MTIEINYKYSPSKKEYSNLVLFVDEKFSLRQIKKYISGQELSYISDLLKKYDLSKKLLVFELNSKKKVILVSIKKNIKNFEIENLGAELYGHINFGKNPEYFICDELNKFFSNYMVCYSAEP